MRPHEPHPPTPIRTPSTTDDTPPFGTGDARPRRRPAQQSPTPAPPRRPAPGTAPPGHAPFEIRDRLIELDDLRKRGIISEEEFAAKKSELLNRI